MTLNRLNQIRKDIMIELSIQAIMHNNWLPYYEDREIRPEKAGELWVRDYGNELVPFFTTEAGEAFPVNNHLVIRNKSGLSLEITVFGDIIHGKNGWIREYPHVLEE